MIGGYYVNKNAVEVKLVAEKIIENDVELMLKALMKIGGVPKVFNFSINNSEAVYRLHGYAKHLVIHNAGSSDIVLSFPSSSGKYYTIPSGEGNANPLTIEDIRYGEVDKLIMRSNGAETKVEVMAIMWPDDLGWD